MRMLVRAATVAIIMLIPLTALAHEDTRERLEEAGFTDEQVEIIAEHFDELDGLLEAEGHDHGHGGFWSEAWELVSDGAHWIQEVFAEIVFFTLEVVLIDRFIHWHRRGKHDLEG